MSLRAPASGWIAAAPAWTPPECAYRVALITGANRGLGLETARQLGARGYTVLLGARDGERGERAAAELRGQGMEAWPLSLDVTMPAQVDAALRKVVDEYGRLDILVNNAGGHYDIQLHASNARMEQLRDALDTHLLGAWRMCEAFVPMMRRQAYGRIVNVSSECGASTTSGDNGPAYRISKSALNTFTRLLASELDGSGVLVNAVCPGWTDTGLGGPGGRPVAEGAASIVWAACLERTAYTGGFYRDGHALAW